MADGLPKEGFMETGAPFSIRTNRIFSLAVFIIGNPLVWYYRSSLDNSQIIQLILLINVVPLILWKFRLGYFTEQEFYDYWDEKE